MCLRVSSFELLKQLTDCDECGTDFMLLEVNRRNFYFPAISIYTTANVRTYEVGALIETINLELEHCE